MKKWLIAGVEHEVCSSGEIFLNGVKVRQHRSNGYRQMRVKGHRSPFRVHRIIAAVYCSNPENKPCINHKDGVKSNNVASNLEWVTYSENQLHAYDVLKRKTNAGQSFGGASITFRKRSKRWEVNVERFGKRYYGGSFKSEIAAKRKANILKTNPELLQRGFTVDNTTRRSNG